MPYPVSPPPPPPVVAIQESGEFSDEAQAAIAAPASDLSTEPSSDHSLSASTSELQQPDTLSPEPNESNGDSVGVSSALGSVDVGDTDIGNTTVGGVGDVGISDAAIGSDSIVLNAGELGVPVEIGFPAPPAEPISSVYPSTSDLNGSNSASDAPTFVYLSQQDAVNPAVQVHLSPYALYSAAPAIVTVSSVPSSSVPELSPWLFDLDQFDAAQTTENEETETLPIEGTPPDEAGLDETEPNETELNEAEPESRELEGTDSGNSNSPTESLPSESSPGEVLVIPEPETPVVEPDSESEQPGSDTSGESGSPPAPQPNQTPAEGNEAPSTPVTTQDILELFADRQEYDEVGQVFEAEGNVELRYREAILTADRLRVNIPNRIAVAEGNAVLSRGQQVLRGDRIEYNLVQNQGAVYGARGELFLPSLSGDTGATPPVEIGGANTTQPLTDRLTTEQPLQVTGSTGGIGFGVNTPNQSGSPSSGAGQVRRLRYEADQIQFVGENWEATNVRITNDPFSPPELELRSSRVTVMPLSPTQTEIRARNPRLVFDQGFSLPLLRDRAVIDSRERDSGLVNFGFDEDDRGGFFIERAFEFNIANAALLRLTPQILVQRAIDEEGFGDPSSYGLLARLNTVLSPTTSIDANASFTSLDFGDPDFDSTYRASIRANQLLYNHRLTLEYSYRDRLYNGSLGFQDVRSSLGFVVTSPNIRLGSSGVTLNYQAGAQLINSDINFERAFGVDADPEDAQDLRDLLPEPDPITGFPDFRIDLMRYQVSASLNRFFLLWAQAPLPATPDQGLRYTPNPVVPYVGFSAGLRGTFSAYGNGDTQSVLTPTVGFSGQFGHFSRPFLDYTGFNVSYSYNAVGGETPFNFDRVNDIQVLSLGLTQQIYGPFRLGVRSNIYLESRNDREDDTDTTFFLEYSRRTYSINLSYSPNREAGALGFRINDFNWTGDPGPFSGIGSDEVTGGVRIPGD